MVRHASFSSMPMAERHSKKSETASRRIAISSMFSACWSGMELFAIRRSTCWSGVEFSRRATLLRMTNAPHDTPDAIDPTTEEGQRTIRHRADTQLREITHAKRQRQRREAEADQRRES